MYVRAYVYEHHTCTDVLKPLQGEVQALEEDKALQLAKMNRLKQVADVCLICLPYMSALKRCNSPR